MLPLKHAASKLLDAYADFRVGATAAEKHCYKPTDSVLLTFDDYGSAAQVETLLEILRQKQVRAMFFVQGDFAERSPELIERMVNAGHSIGNHTYSHPVLTKLPAAEIRDQISRGVAGPWFRPPQGRYNATIRKIAAELGYVICYWTIDSRDWTGASIAEMRHTILTELHPDAVILMHIHADNTAAMLPQLIDDIRGRGFTLTGFKEQVWSPSQL